MFDFMYVDGVNVLTYAEEQKKAAEEQKKAAEEVFRELQEQRKLNEKAMQEIQALKAALAAQKPDH